MKKIIILFATFFSRKGNQKYLIDFLNSILHIDINTIDVKEEVNLERLSTNEKGGRLDIQAKLNDGLIVNIEMQMRNLNNIEKRNDVYEAKTISRYFGRGEKYEDAAPVISIYILNYNLFGFDEYILETIKVLEKHRDYQVTSISKEYYIQLPKFRNSNPDMNVKLNQWLAFIDDEDKGLVELAKKKNEVIYEAGVEVRRYSEEDQAKYMATLMEMWESDWASEMGYARDEGLKQRIGRTEGNAELNSGIEQRKKRAEY